MKNDITPRNPKPKKQNLDIQQPEQEPKRPLFNNHIETDSVTHPGLPKHKFTNNRSGLLLGATLGAFLGSLLTFLVTRYSGIEPTGFFAILAMLVGALIGIIGDLIFVGLKSSS